MNTTDHDPDQPSITSRVLRWLQIVVAFTLAVFLLGVTVGSTAALLEDEVWRWKPVAVSLGSFLAFAACSWWVWKLKPLGRRDEPMSKRTKAARRYVIASLVFGVVIGIVISLSALPEGDVGGMVSGPLPRTPAIFAAIAYVLFLPVVGWLHLRSIDEHEAKANYEGALAGMYAYSTITPAWWMCERAGVLPPIDAMAVFTLVMIVWGLVWLWRRHA